MSSITDAAGRAGDYLLAAAETGFAETMHSMRFPRAAGFSARNETQCSDTFARAILGGVLVDLAAVTRERDFAAALRRIARREAEHVAAKRLRGCAGGWSYFPELPELPPDADSLAAALSLFTRTAPELVAQCDGPVALVLDSQAADGSIETWILGGADNSRRARWRDAIRRHWGRDRAVDVCARFFLALHHHEPERYRIAVEQGARFVARGQEASGAWSAQWYFGTCYPTLLAVDLLAALGQEKAATARAAAGISASQRDDGGWGVWQSVPLDTAIALWLLGRADPVRHRQALRRGVIRLLDLQTSAGFWNGSPWIKMDIGRAQERISHTLSYRSATLTTAFCLRALLLLQDDFPDVA